jgi:hypothetical protein
MSSPPVWLNAFCDAIAERPLEKDPTARFASADDLVAALGNTPAGGTQSGAVNARAAGSGDSAPASKRARGIARPVAWLVAALLMIAVGSTLRNKLATAKEDPRRSLLVGCFENTTRDPSLEWLRIGGVELLARSLARWTDLRVGTTRASCDSGRTPTRSSIRSATPPRRRSRVWIAATSRRCA